MARASSSRIEKWWSRNRMTSWLGQSVLTSPSWSWATPLGGGASKAVQQPDEIGLARPETWHADALDP